MTGQQTKDLRYMRLRVDSLYQHDDRSRMTAINQWDGGDAPRFYLGRSAGGNLWRFRFDVADDLAAEISRHCEAEPVADNPVTPPTYQRTYLSLLVSDIPFESCWSGPAYRFPDASLVQPVTTITITANNAHLLQSGLDDWLPDVGHRQPMVAVVENERAVALCASVRITISAHEAGVETLPEYRRRGYAVRTVRAWASAVRANGATPFYSTSWSNAASQGVAGALGLAMIGSDFSIT